MDILEEIGRGNKGYGSTGINYGQSEINQNIKAKLSLSRQNSVEDSKNDVQAANETVPR